MTLLAAASCIPPGNSEGRRLAVIAYWYGDATDIEKHAIGELTHINFSFVHLKGNALNIQNSRDSLDIRRLVSLKSRYPELKILVSLGGWGGCETCSDVFASVSGRREFAESVRDQLHSFNVDGIDLDWEYPAIAGYPGHPFRPEDRRNFTLLLQELRRTLGPGALITFAAGGFSKYLRESVEWDQVMPLVDFVNLMTYDYVHGASPATGHLTPLFPTAEQPEATGQAVHVLDSIGVPSSKIVIGIAFYARTWRDVPDRNSGLYQPGTFESYVSHRDLPAYFEKNNGFRFLWDSVAQAPYAYNAQRHLFATYDDERSVAAKTRYAMSRGLGGVMFWELSEDSDRDGLLDAIHQASVRQQVLPHSPALPDVAR